MNELIADERERLLAILTTLKVVQLLQMMPVME